MSTTRIALISLTVAAGALLVASSVQFEPSHAAAAPKTKPAAARAGAAGFPPLSSYKAWVVPADVTPAVGQGATLSDAAVFAWKEFIALNWPAVPQTGAGGTRGNPNPTAHLGDDSDGPNGGVDTPVVWETLRSKVETFPGYNDPPGYDVPGAQDYGYDAAPAYDYGSRVYTTQVVNGQTSEVQQRGGATPYSVNPCSGQVSVNNAAWVNLDEINQIGDNSMYQGLVPPAPTQVNAQPRLIRFLAKGNRTFYTYVAAKNYWYQNLSYFLAQTSFMNQATANNYQSGSGNIRLPTGTILVKAAWREMAPTDPVGHYLVKTVRYYEDDGSGHACYRERPWALIGLHIIQKTLSAPYFIFATFEQSDNIVSIVPSGSGTTAVPVEDANGNPNPNDPNPPTSYTTPVQDYFDADNKYYAQNYPNNVPPAAALPPPSVPNVVSIGGPCAVASTPSELYYDELQYDSNRNPIPLTPPINHICVNQRYNAVPQLIVDVNTSAHQAIAAYTSKGPWQYYKLVNVQYQPFNLNEFSATNMPSTYFQSNSVIETDNGLQQFFGNPAFTGSIFAKSFYESGKISNGQAFNVYIPPPPPSPPAPYSGPFTRYTMGGCMGCHGRAQQGGNDFSFTLSGGPVAKPEFAEPASSQAKGIDLARLNKLHKALSSWK